MSRRDDGWLSDAAHAVLQQQTEQNLASARQEADAAEKAREQAEQIRNGQQ